MTRQEKIDQIIGAWHQEIGGDDLFKKSYDAIWTNGPPKQWSDGDEFFKDFNWMKGFIQKMHPKDIEIIWNISCNGK